MTVIEEVSKSFWKWRSTELHLIDFSHSIFFLRPFGKSVSKVCCAAAHQTECCSSRCSFSKSPQKTVNIEIQQIQLRCKQGYQQLKCIFTKNSCQRVSLGWSYVAELSELHYLFRNQKNYFFSPVQKHQKQFADVTLVYYNTHIKMGITIYHIMYICFIVSKSRFWLFHGFFMEIFLCGSVGICLYDVGKKKGTRLLCLRLWATPKLGKSTSAWS